MTDTQISCFLACAEMRSLSKASQALYCAPQAISKSVLKMEEELGCQMFFRTAQGLSLTEAGIEYYNYFKSFRQQFHQTIHTMQHVYEVMRLNFTLGLSNYIDPYGKIFPYIRSFADRHPSTAFRYLHLDNQALLAGLEEGTIDLAIMCDSQIPNRIENHVEAFASEDLRLFFPERRAEGECTEFTLLDSPYAAWSSQQWEATAKRLASKHIPANLRQIIHLPNLKSTIVNLEHGYGMAVCDANFGYATAERSSMNHVSIGMKSSLACVWNEKNENPLLAEFSLHLHQCARGEPQPAQHESTP